MPFLWGGSVPLIGRRAGALTAGVGPVAAQAGQFWSGTGGSNVTAAAQEFVPSADIVVDSLSAYLRDWDSSLGLTARLAVLDADRSTYLAQTDAFNGASVSKWRDFPVQSSVELSQGVTYWLGWEVLTTAFAVQMFSAATSAQQFRRGARGGVIRYATLAGDGLDGSLSSSVDAALPVVANRLADLGLLEAEGLISLLQPSSTSLRAGTVSGEVDGAKFSVPSGAGVVPVRGAHIYVGSSQAFKVSLWDLTSGTLLRQVDHDAASETWEPVLFDSVYECQPGRTYATTVWSASPWVRGQTTTALETDGQITYSGTAYATGASADTVPSSTAATTHFGWAVPSI